MSAGQIYVKMLPDGEARPLTTDARVKYNLAFSPDGSQIAYTVLEDSTFATYTISVLGGDPHLLLSNAAGLTWLDPHHFLFSRLRSGLHMGIVTESVTGDDFRELYYPPHERAMAHYSYASPDRKSALVVEMNGQGEWTLCQLISLEGAVVPTTGGTRRRVHCRGLVPRWNLDVFHRDRRRPESLMAPAISDGSPRADHLRPRRGGRIGNPARRPLRRHLGRRTAEFHLDARSCGGTIPVLRGRDRCGRIPSVLWSQRSNPLLPAAPSESRRQPGTLAPDTRHRQERGRLPRN